MTVGGENKDPWGWGASASTPDAEWYPPPAGPTDPQWYPQVQPGLAESGVPAYGGFGGNPPRSKRRGRILIVVAMAAAAGLIAVALALVVPGGTRSAQAAVIESVNNAVASKTAHASLTMNVNSGEMTGTGEGAIDFTNGAMDISMDMSSVEQGLKIRLVYLGGTIFEQIPQISQLFPGKSWVSLDLSSLAKASGGSGAMNLGGNPAAMLRLLTQEGAAVNSVGNSDINGVPVKGYVVTIDPSFIQKQIHGADLPSWLSQAISKVNFQDATETVFIDSSGKLVRDTIHMAMSLAGSNQPAVTMDESLDLSDYGTPVSISAPPAGQVVDLQQFLQNVAGQANS